MKKILLESFGALLYRLTLPVDASENVKTMFANLLWVIQGENESERGEVESFTCTPQSLHNAIRAFRIARTAVWFHATKWPAGARVRNRFMPSGYSFAKVAQRKTGRDLPIVPCSLGNADYSNATDSTFDGVEPSLAKGTSKE